MAEARLLRKKISKSERVNKLPESAQIIYTWMLGHLDVEGRFSGNPRVVKNIVIPLKKHSIAKVDKWLDMMADLKDDITGQGLIERYKVNGNQYLWYPGFAGEQSPRGGQAWKTWEAPSDIPAPPDASEAIPAQPRKRKVAEPTDDILDPVFGQMVQVFRDNVSDISPMLSGRLKLIQDEYPEGWFAKAVNEAVTYGKRNLKYIEAILKNWKANGINPLKEIPAKEKAEHGRTQEYNFI